jgi:CheY-like chemotaxis protein
VYGSETKAKTMAKTKILIAENETIIAMEIKDRLKSLGYAVPAVVSTGVDAIQEIAKTPPDLTLIDIRLKGEMDGIETAAQIRTQYDVPVVYLAAYADEDTLQRAKITEPFGYLIQPFAEQELHAAIEIALYKHQREQALRESAHLYTETRRRAQELTILNEAGRAMTSSLKLDAVLAQMISAIRKLLEAEDASVLLYEPNSDELVFAAVTDPFSKSLVGTRIPISEGIAGWTAQEGLPLLENNVQGNPHFYNQIDEITGLTTRSLIAVPLIHKETVIGVWY